MTCPLRSAGITLLQHYYEAVRPSPAHRYFRPRGVSVCAFSLGITGQVLKFRRRARMRVTPPLHRTPHGQVGYPPCPSRNEVKAPVSTSSNDGLRCFSQRFACARLSHSYMTRSKPRLLTMTFTTAAFDRSSSWQFEASSYTATPRGHPSSLLQHDARASS